MQFLQPTFDGEHCLACPRLAQDHQLAHRERPEL